MKQQNKLTFTLHPTILSKCLTIDISHKKRAIKIDGVIHTYNSITLYEQEELLLDKNNQIQILLNKRTSLQRSRRKSNSQINKDRITVSLNKLQTTLTNSIKTLHKLQSLDLSDINNFLKRYLLDRITNNNIITILVNDPLTETDINSLQKVSPSKELLFKNQILITLKKLSILNPSIRIYLSRGDNTYSVINTGMNCVILDRQEQLHKYYTGIM